MYLHIYVVVPDLEYANKATKDQATHRDPNWIPMCYDDTIQMIITSMKYDSHTFLIDNHVRLHSSQNASYTEDVCDMHLRLTAKPHLCVICSTFHT